MKMENHCVCSKLHSDFVYINFECANKALYQSYTVIYSRLHRYGTALPEEQLGQHEILRREAGCGRRLRMTW